MWQQLVPIGIVPIKWETKLELKESPCANVHCSSIRGDCLTYPPWRAANCRRDALIQNEEKSLF